jgi:hypothetical protein
MNDSMMLIVAIATLWLGRVSAASSPEALALIDNNNGLASAILVRDGQPLRRQLQEDEDVCDQIYNFLKVENPGASCECKRKAGTFTCVNPSECFDDELTACGNGGGESCEVVTTTYDWSIQGNTVEFYPIRYVVEYTGGQLRSEEVQVIGKERCDYFMTTLDGLRYQCNHCSYLECSGDEVNVDCSNIQADSTTHGQCVSLGNTTADVGLLNGSCVEGPIVPTTLPVPAVVPSAATDLSTGYIMLVITVTLICPLLMTCHIIACLYRARRAIKYLQLQ